MPKHQGMTTPLQIDSVAESEQLDVMIDLTTCSDEDLETLCCRIKLRYGSELVAGALHGSGRTTTHSKSDTFFIFANIRQILDCRDLLNRILAEQGRREEEAEPPFEPTNSGEGN